MPLPITVAQTPTISGANEELEKPAKRTPRSQPTMIRRVGLGLRRHLKTWKDSYEVTGVFTAALVSAYAAIISARSITIAEEALRIQRHESALRTRPYLNILFPRIADGEFNGTNGRHLNALTFQLANLSEIPATRVWSSEAVWSSTVKYTNYPTGEAFLMKDDPKSLIWLLKCQEGVDLL